MPKIHSIRTKIVCSIVLFALVISTVLVCVSYFTYKSTMDEHYDTLGNNVAQTAISMIDEDVMLEYSRGVAFADPQSTMASQEYQSIITTLDNIKESNNVLYLYIIYPTESGSYFIFDTDHSKDSCPYGYYMEYYEGSFSKIAHRLVRGETVPAVISNKDYGWIISISHPYISSGGELIGYVCVDISMEQVVRDRQAFLLNCILVMAVITVIFAFVYMFVFNKIFVGPIKQMTTATAAFVSDRGDDDRVLSPISLLKVKTNDELQTLCESLKKMELDLNLHIDNLKNITAEKERIGAELNVATHIQESMLPSIFPAFPDRQEFDIYATMNPAKEVGGDFYDFFMVDERHLAVVMADVSGKGVPAALFMVIGKTLIKDHTQPGRDLGDVFSEINNLLCESNSEGLFITAFEGVLNLVTGEFKFVNAGHELPFICPAGGGFESYKINPGFVLAGMEGIKYTAGSMMLSPGDKVFQYTDGVTEATNGDGKLYGMDRLSLILNTVKDKAPGKILPAVKNDIDLFVGTAPQFDDITMLCLEFKAKMAESEGVV
ncbi:PP2C family protein-serine/threonine phosphatase [Murimonas intestini]|uniref:Sigma-B regulation protein RsbU (Phosphoserine phosphatase) n=1 Tax=Murimonas intestini TaxID=1337051 RepID=A0AB73T4V8_9FIRM|nr:SpoIIE family protein phosphatase [Murimonas intestini]MCR1840577.1 SpoIIE family protein phosphatase [Murimonas intestini]MCR1865370.1 SpoIIE family protein phosphatase [Murimonas intestini]MCR1882919.1 SpoIIE family protein phosphatase [Murimonas intestini]